MSRLQAAQWTLVRRIIVLKKILIVVMILIQVIISIPTNKNNTNDISNIVNKQM